MKYNQDFGFLIFFKIFVRLGLTKCFKNKICNSIYVKIFTLMQSTLYNTTNNSKQKEYKQVSSSQYTYKLEVMIPFSLHIFCSTFLLFCCCDCLTILVAVFITHTKCNKRFVSSLKTCCECV